MTKKNHVSILGVQISPVNMKQAVGNIADWIEARQPNYVCCVPAHSVMECVDHPELLDTFNHSGMTTPDGMPMVWLCHWYGFDHVERVYGPDLMLAVCEHGIKPGYRHYLYGGEPGVGERLANCLRARFPDLQIVGIESPPFRSLTPEEESQIGLRIREACPDIVWVGISSPKQERWMAEHINRFEVPVMVGVGAAFDFLSGIKDQAPRWIQTSGFEWLYRLFHEPRRLWRRYILGYPRFIILIAIQMLKGRG